jgi:hypothetical protein
MSRLRLDARATVRARDQRRPGVAVLPDGSPLIADIDNNRVRRVSPGGSTIAGTPGSAGDGGPDTPSPNSTPPPAISLVPGGGQLVADTGNHRIRHIGP